MEGGRRGGEGGGAVKGVTTGGREGEKVQTARLKTLTCSLHPVVPGTD